jgi:hypothetical protein
MMRKRSSTDQGSQRRIPRIAVVIPFLALIAWFWYMWFVSDVLPSMEKDPKTGRVRAEGYVKRVKWGEYQRQGRWVTYHENGQKASEGSYRDGAKDGEWKYWDESGRPVTSAPVATP